jgi:hypothetical protein
MQWETDFHVPSYAEWLAEADLTATYQAARTGGGQIISGSIHLERLHEIGVTFPGAALVHVRSVPAVVFVDAAEKSFRARKLHSDEVEYEKVVRYWEWRIGLLVERGEAGIAEHRHHVVTVDHDDVRRDVNSVARRVWAELDA